MAVSTTPYVPLTAPGFIATSWNGHTSFHLSTRDAARITRWVEREELHAEARRIAREVVRIWATRRGY